MRDEHQLEGGRAGISARDDCAGRPLFFANAAEAYQAEDGPFGKELHALLEPKGLVGLSYW